MNELMYDQSNLAIVTWLLVFMLLSVELGYRVGRRKSATATEHIRSQVNTVLAAMLGLLALLLGFTYSLALQRYEDRSQAVVAEANAIGTTYLRAQLLPAGIRADIQGKLRQYVDIRVREGRLSLDDAAKDKALVQQGSSIAAQVWELAMQAVAKDDRPATTGLFIQALNDMIDSADRHHAALDRHVPESVLFLVFLTFVMTTAILGYASGVSSHRVTIPGITLVVLIALVVYLIIDLDRPRRGLIQVNQESLLSAQRAMAGTPDSPNAGSARK